MTDHANKEATAPADAVQRGGAGLTQLLRLETLQTLQDRFALLGQLSVCICDVDGRPITRAIWGSRYSQLIGTSSRGHVEWLDGVKRVCREPSPSEPVVVLEGMTLYGAPVVHHDRRLAVIVVGTRPLDLPPPPGLREIAARYGLDGDQLIDAGRPAHAFTGGTPEAIYRFADLLADTLATAYGQAERIGLQLADLRVVHGVGELLAGSRDLQEILDATVKRVVEVMPVKACGIRLLDEESGELVVKAVHNLSDEYLRKGPVTLHQNAIDTAAFRGETVYIADVPNDPRIRYPENARREGIVSGLCVPMTSRRRTIGVLRVYTDKPYEFGESEERLLKSIAAQAAAVVIASQVHEARAKSERVARQVEAARHVQQRMLPSSRPPHPALDIGCVYEPSLQLGGDFYDFIPWPSGGLCVCIADVVGKGVPAALLMASVRASLRAHAGAALDIADLAGRVNRELGRDTLDSEFATLFLGLFSPDGRRLTFCNAGHVPPILLSDNSVSRLFDGGVVIGVSETETYVQRSMSVKPGDVLVLATDGVTEAFDFDERAYGTVRAIRSIRRHRDLAAQPMARQLLWDVRRFAGLAEQSDDITIVVAKVRA